MDNITINGSTSYDVYVEHGIIGRMGELLRDEFSGEKALVVSDSNVAALYLSNVSESLREAGYETSTIVLAAGEQTKSIDNYVFLQNLLSEREFAKTDILIALGGGVIGDLVGFAASTYKRGIRCVQVPTSLLAAVDSSVGGKTAINLPSAKNQVGIIRNPAVVICDPDVMTSLPQSELRNGYAEIIKYGILNGEDIIEDLRLALQSQDYQDVIVKSVSIKRDIVEMDEGDNDFRQFLNLGHLIGHAIEANSDYAITHGTAVAMGLALEAKCCSLSGYAEMGTYLAISALLEEFNFETSCIYSWSDLMPYILRDKRIRDGKIQILVPEHIGNCVMRELPVSKLESFIRLGL